MSFDAYIQNRTSQFETLTKKIDSTNNKKKSYTDDRFWKPVMGKDGSGYAVIRFLPGKDANSTPWVKLFTHAFQGPTGKWFIENSRTTLGEADPVSEMNTKLWNSGIESNKDVVRKQKRRTHYIANVLVLKDPANPSAEGKVHLYKFGQKIFDKVTTAMQPEFADETPMNPFDLMEGANFKVKMKIVSGFWNYDASDFEKQAPISEDHAKLKTVFDAQYDVRELIAPTEFKSYNDLKVKLDTVLEGTAPMSAPAANPVSRPATAETTKSDATFDKVFKAEVAPAAKAEDDNLEDYFKSLADK